MFESDTDNIMTPGTIRLATRGSDLALRQANEVKAALSPRQSVELVTVDTRGDKLRDELIHRLGTTGAFVRSLDEKVLAGELDAAVHSMKDMPTEMPEDMVVAGIPERASPADVLITPDSERVTLDDLPSGAVVGTASLRRKAHLLSTRPDLAVEPLRGNVDTRIEKLLAPTLQREYDRRQDDEDGNESEPPDAWLDSLNEIEQRAFDREIRTEYDAIVLAEAGLDRSGLSSAVSYQRLPPTEFVPAPGQGVIAVTAVTDGTAEMLYDAINHPPTRVTSTVERTVLSELGAGCIAPIGVYARLRGEYVTVVARVLSRDGTEEIAATRDLPVERHPTTAQEFGADLREQGAADLIEQARAAENETDGQPVRSDE